MELRGRQGRMFLAHGKFRARKNRHESAEHTTTTRPQYMNALSSFLLTPGQASPDRVVHSTVSLHYFSLCFSIAHQEASGRMTRGCFFHAPPHARYQHLDRIERMTRCIASSYLVLGPERVALSTISSTSLRVSRDAFGSSSSFPPPRNPE